jgi:hypothetical protein
MATLPRDPRAMADDELADWVRARIEEPAPESDALDYNVLDRLAAAGGCGCGRKASDPPRRRGDLLAIASASLNGPPNLREPTLDPADAFLLCAVTERPRCELGEFREFASRLAIPSSRSLPSTVLAIGPHIALVTEENPFEDSS